jgi:protease II
VLASNAKNEESVENYKVEEAMFTSQVLSRSMRLKEDLFKEITGRRPKANEQQIKKGQ